MRLQDRVLCASITCITGTYAEPEGRVIFDHRHNAAKRYVGMTTTEHLPEEVRLRGARVLPSAPGTRSRTLAVPMRLRIRPWR